MADFYVDHRAYATVLGATPTWGVPQEGDGSGLNAATSAAAAFVTFSAAPSSGTLSVCGITISTTGVIGAASADAAADNLATNINAVTTTVAAGVAGGVPALKNLVYARGPSGGAPAGTCQVMMRVGSAGLNYANNTNCLIASTFNNETSSAANKQFSGGTGGCWGWFINDVTVGGDSATYAAGAFGLLSPAKPFVSVASGASVLGEPTQLDTVWGRSGAGQTITLPNNVSVLLSSALNLNFVLDTNTKWTGDSGTGQVTISQAASGASVNPLKFSSISAAKSIGCLGKDRLRFYFRSASAGGLYQIESNNPGYFPLSRAWNLLFEEAAGLPTSQGVNIRCANYTMLALQGCRFVMPTARSTWPDGIALIGGSINGTLSMEGCSVEANFTSLTDPGPVASISVGNKSEIRLTSCAFTGWSSGNLKPFSISSGASSGSLVVENCTGLRIDSGTYIGIPSANNGIDEYSGRFVYQSADVGLSMRDEHKRGVCDWVYGAGYPTLRALQPDGTPWCVKMDWLATAGIVGEHIPFRSIPFWIQYRETAAVKKIETDIYVPNEITLDAVTIVMRVMYISNTTGRIVEEHTKGLASAYLASAASWTPNSVSSYSAKKLSLTTSQAIKANTAITVYIEFHRPAPGSNRQIYVDPEFAVLTP